MSITGLQGVFGFHRQIGGNKGNDTSLVAKGPYDAGVGGTPRSNTVQKLTVVGTSGTFRLQYRGAISAPINVATLAGLASGSQAASLESSIESMFAELASPAASDIAISGNLASGFTLTFGGFYAGYAVGFTVYDTAMPSGGSVSIAAVSKDSDTSSLRTGGTWYWLPATQVNFQPNQIVQAIPMEVGGNLFSRGSYKGGVSGQGQVTMVPRGGLGLAELFYAFTGNRINPAFDTVNSDPQVYSATTFNTHWGAGSGVRPAERFNKIKAVSSPLAVNKAYSNDTETLAVGMTKYVFTPQSGTNAELPWYTIVRNVGGKFVEEFGDARLGNFSFDIGNTNLLMLDASFVSRQCGTIAVNSTGIFGDTTNSKSVGAQTAGNGIPFQAVDAVVKLDTKATVNGQYEPSTVAENGDLLPTRLNIAFANELSSNEHVVGSYYLQDITNLSRTANITYSAYLKDPDLYARTYAYGKDIVTQDASWSSKIWKGALELTLLGGDVPGVTGQQYKIRVSIPEMDYMATPISLAGNSLVEYQLTTNVVLSQDIYKAPFVIEYWTNEDIY